MSITDELRGYAHDCCARIDDDIHAIADRIDAEHEAKVTEAASGWDFWESTHVKLPVDADGEPIHIGERVQLIGNDPSTVSHMILADDGWRVYVKYDGGIGTGSGEPKRIRHYHAPTVEDVLREFADRVCSIGHQWGLDAADTIAEYAAKLRLAEGEGA